MSPDEGPQTFASNTGRCIQCAMYDVQTPSALAFNNCIAIIASKFASANRRKITIPSQPHKYALVGTQMHKNAHLMHHDSPLAANASSHPIIPSSSRPVVLWSYRSLLVTCSAVHAASPFFASRQSPESPLFFILDYAAHGRVDRGPRASSDGRCMVSAWTRGASLSTVLWL